jgi:hypothetical protein
MPKQFYTIEAQFENKLSVEGSVHKAQFQYVQFEAVIAFDLIYDALLAGAAVMEQAVTAKKGTK